MRGDLFPLFLRGTAGDAGKVRVKSWPIWICTRKLCGSLAGVSSRVAAIPLAAGSPFIAADS